MKALSPAAMRYKMAKSFWEQDDKQEEARLIEIAKNLDSKRPWPHRVLKQLPCGHHMENASEVCSWDCECGSCPTQCNACGHTFRMHSYVVAGGFVMNGEYDCHCRSCVY